MLTQDAIDRARQADLLALAGVELRKIAGTGGGEYAGPCPICGGRDRFRVQPNGAGGPRWYCRQCGGGQWHDAIDLVQQRDRVDFAEAVARLTGSAPELASAPTAAPAPAAMPEPTEAPGALWQERAQTFCQDCRQRLWSDAGKAALAGLRARGLADDTIFEAGLGWNDHDRREDRAAWGLEGKTKVWLPRGVVIPWLIGGQLWRVNIRRPAADVAKSGPKYIGPAGSSNGLYGADGLRAGFPAVLVEGEIDALTLAQHAGNLAAPVATGSTHGARRARWLGRLALASSVLVCYDADEPGQAAASYWLGALSNARRWRPYWADANAMAQDGADLRQWLAVGLGAGQQAGLFDAAPEPDSRQETGSAPDLGPAVKQWETVSQAPVIQDETGSAPEPDSRLKTSYAGALVAGSGHAVAQDAAPRVRPIDAGFRRLRHTVLDMAAELDQLLAELGRAPGQGLEFARPGHTAHAAWLRFCALDSQWARLAAVAEYETFEELEAATGAAYLAAVANPSDQTLARAYARLDDAWAAVLELPEVQP